MRGIFPALLSALALAPAVGGLVGPLEFPDHCVVAAEGTCEFVCRLNQPLFLVAAGAGQAWLDCAGGAAAACPVVAGACAADLTGLAGASGLGSCRGSGDVAVFCGSPLSGPLAGV